MDIEAGAKFARNGINELIAYVPGKPVEEVVKEYGVTEIIMLAANENPLGTSPKAKEMMQQMISNVYMYPEGSSFALREKIAANYGINDNMVILGNGADNILFMIAQAFVNQGDEVIIGDPTFSVYETTTLIMGGNVVKVPLKDFTYDLSALAERITDKTKLIFVCNPNNPTGTIVSEEEVAKFMDVVPKDCIVVFDEAYLEYVDSSDFPKTIKYVNEQRNVLIVRTLSKVYGLAGLRVGYAVGPEYLIHVLRKVVEPFPVNRMAQAGALGALDDNEFLETVLSVTKEGKEYLIKEFTKLGMAYAPSQTNFVFVDLGVDAQEVAKELLKEGIIIRPGNIWDLPTFARITIGTLKQNEKLIQALTKIIKK